MRGIDEPKVSAWLAANIAGAQAPFTYEFIAGGRSNLTFKVFDAFSGGSSFTMPLNVGSL